MAILVDETTKVIVQGITGRDGSFHAKKMLEYGTKVVGGVTPGKGGKKINGFLVFDSVKEIKEATQANASVIFVPAPFAFDAIIEAIDAGLELVVCISEGIPTLDMLKVVSYLKDKKTRVIGPNSPGVISPGKTKIGILPPYIFKKGNVGIVSRSGTLTYEIVSHITRAGLGESTCVGIGGDPVVGSNFIDILKLFKEDPQTEAVVLIGEIGGTDEEEAVEFIKREFPKPVVAFIAGKTAPPGKRMGHAGAIISCSSGTAQEKIKTFRENGIPVAEEPEEVAPLLKKILKQN